MRKQLVEAAIECFGTGWAWLFERSGENLELATQNAGTPITMGATPLLTVNL